MNSCQLVFGSIAVVGGVIEALATFSPSANAMLKIIAIARFMLNPQLRAQRNKKGARSDNRTCALVDGGSSAVSVADA
jgi:2-iminoacetate synthase ThiH